MEAPVAGFVPPHCPNERCHYHRVERSGWRFVRIGCFTRQRAPRRIQRFQCRHCRRRFSSQTFATDYWLRRPRLADLFGPLVACSGFRQIARSLGCSPALVALQASRLGRHGLLFHQSHRPPVREPLALDTFVGFEFSQFAPTGTHTAVGRSHFFYGFTTSELRRSGTMTPCQKRRRAALERSLGRPDPRATERDVAALLATLCPHVQRLELHTDLHTGYPLALRRLTHLAVDHRTVSSRAARTPRNPLFPVNLLDLLIRHSGANHKRETIAFAKRRASSDERLWLFAVWRNWIKPFSERRRGETPAMRLGLTDHRWTVAELLARRMFPGRIGLPPLWERHYRRDNRTRYLPVNRTHRLRYAD